MARFDTMWGSWTSGELSPLMAGRVDFKKYFTGAALITNFLCRTQGPLFRRPGSQFIAATKDSSKKSRIVPFIFSTTQAYVLEFGDLYIRFYMNKGQIVSGSSPYEIITPYTDEQVADLQFVQSADTLYVCHPAHPPAKITRSGHTAWSYNIITFKDGPYLDVNTSEMTLNFGSAFGVELVKNGAFTTVPDTNWTWGNGWAQDVTNHYAVHTAGDTDVLSQDLGSSTYQDFQLTYTVKNCIDGSVVPSIKNTNGIVRSTNGRFIQIIHVVLLGNVTVKFTPSNDFDGVIDSVSVKALVSTNSILTATPSVGGELVDNPSFATVPDTNWIWGTGWAQETTNHWAAHSAGSVAALEQAISPTIGKDYQLVYTIKNQTVGSIIPQIGGKNGITRATNGGYTETIVNALTTGNLKFVPSIDFDGDIDDVSVKEISGVATLFDTLHVGSLWRLDTAYVRVTAFISNLQVTAEPMGTVTPPTSTQTWREGAWSGYRGYPRTLSFYEERLFFAGSPYRPQTIWGSVSGDYENFTPEATITDAGPLTYTISSNQVDAILWLSPGRVLLAGTQEAEYKISGSSASTALTPTDVAVRRDTSYGSAGPPPVTLGNVTLFLQHHGRKVRELTYDFTSDSYVAPDLTLLCEHITKPAILAMDYQSDPDQTLWAVRSDGVLLSMIYERPQDVVGWAKHRTDGLFESVATIPGVNQTEIWVIVNRTVVGQTKRYIECFKDVDWAERADAFLSTEAQKYANAFFVDCGLTYDSATPATVFSGLDHLAGKTVHILADGVLQEPQEVVASGSDWIITLPNPAYVVHAGLPYSSMMLTMRPEGGVQGGTSQGKIKKVSKVTLRVDRSLGCKVGPDADHLENLEFRSVADSMDTALPLFTGDFTTEFLGDIGESDGQVMVVQDQPLPLTICGIIPEMEVSNSLAGMIWDKVCKLASSLLGIWR